MKPNHSFFSHVLIVGSIVLFSFSSIFAQNPHSVEFSFSAGGGYRVRNNPFGYYSYNTMETPRFSYGATIEYQRHVNRVVSVGIGLEYQNANYGMSSIETYSDSTFVLADVSMEHHYIGTPLRIYINVLNKPAAQLYFFSGLRPGITADIVYEYHVRGVEEPMDFSYSMFQFSDYYSSGYYGIAGIIPMRFSLEAQVGFGGRFHFSPHWYAHTNIMFGINTLPTYAAGVYGYTIGEHSMRFGGNAGIGYSF